MTLNTLNLGNNGTIVYQGHAGFLVSTVLGLYRGYNGIMEKKMATTIV